MSEHDGRQRKGPGADTGNAGHFARTERPASRIRLAGRFHEARARYMQENGYLPAATFSGRSSNAKSFWDTAHDAGEYRADGEDHAKMPEHYSPSQSAGESRRRTARRTYDGGGIRLTMPAAGAIRGYSAAYGNPAFDVPVQFQTEGGEPVIGWVRVRRTGPGTWDTTALAGANTMGGARVAEAVAAVLESRRPTLALAEAGNLIAARRQRVAANGAPLTEDKAGFITGHAYSRAAGVLAVRLGSRLYGYKVSPSDVAAMRDSERPGQVYNALIRKRPGAGVSQCGACRNVFALETGHDCPLARTSRPRPMRRGQPEALRRRFGRVRDAERRRAPEPGPQRKYPGRKILPGDWPER